MNNHHPLSYLRLTCIFLVISFTVNISKANDSIYKQGYITAEYLQSNLPDVHPRLLLTPEKLSMLLQKRESDPFFKAYFENLASQTIEMFYEPLPAYKVYDGRRILSISRKSLHNLSVLSLVYLAEKNDIILQRIDDELIAVCNFPNWNPSHFLDVGEMALAVSIAYDWVGEYLPASTRELAKQALMEKALIPGFAEPQPWWVRTTNNWNQVCHGGLIAASVVIGHDEPELAARAIDRALFYLPNAMSQYAPDGIYPEGVMYWGYGTAYTIIAIEALRNAFGSDFGISNLPGFLQSPDYVLQNVAHTGEFFNFFDCGNNYKGAIPEGITRRDGWFHNQTMAVNLSWFAFKTGNGTFFNPESFATIKSMNDDTRFIALASSWLSEIRIIENKLPAPVWKGDGPNPLAIFSWSMDDEYGYYLGTKGGRASISHGHMDAGSFIFELDGVRWSIDVGQQPYAPLERAGYDQWSFHQDSPRWALLTKGSHSHSTVQVNQSLHHADGAVTINAFSDGTNGNPAFVTYDMSPLFFDNVGSFTRTFTRESARSAIITDEFTLNDNTEIVTWQMITTAKVFPTENGAVLQQNGKELKLEIIDPQGFSVSIVSLDPPPLKYDLQVENLKRIEVQVPAWYLSGNQGKITIRLSGEN